MKNKAFLAIITATVLQSCISMKDMDAVETGLIHEENPAILKGIYENYPLSEEGDDLYKLLFKPFKTYKYQEVKNYTGEIEIEILSDRKLKITFLRTDEAPISKTLKGRYKNGFFLTQRKIRPIGIPLIFYIYRERRVMIGLNQKNELIVKMGRFDFGNFLIFSGGDQNVFLNKFRKLPSL